MLVLAALYALWLPAFRIQTVNANDADQRAIDAARQALTGSYAHIIPRNSIFFLPKEGMRQAVLNAYPDVAAVSVNRTSFSSIRIATTPRTKAFVWCGTGVDAPFADGCFDADAEGLVFEPADTLETTGTTTEAAPQSGELRIYAPLDPQLGEGESPVRHSVTNAAAIPDALRFVKALRGMGASISALVLRGDEADLWIDGKTRITYVLGHEQEASQLAASALPKLPISDGTIQYIDLRFSGKVYVKKYGE